MEKIALPLFSWRREFAFNKALSGEDSGAVTRGPGGHTGTAVLEKLFAEGLMLSGYKCMEVLQREVKPGKEI